MAFANAVVKLHKDFDIVKFAEDFFDTDKMLLIVQETGKKGPHWHVHGTWIGDKKAYAKVPHALRTGEGRAQTRPVSVGFDKDKIGFQYICKEDPPRVVRKWHISDEQIAEWHKASNASKKDTKRLMRNAMKRVADEHEVFDITKTPGRGLFRELKRACYDHLVEEEKLLNPQNVRQHVLTYMWTEFPKYKEFVLDQ